MTELKQLSEYIWEIPKSGNMVAPGRVYGDRYIIDQLLEEEKTSWSALKQLQNVACLPGIQKYALALADVHPGYGSPIGGVAAFDMEKGVITFGAVGFDINCIEGKSRVLHEFGYTRRISDLETTWFEERLCCLNPHKKLRSTGIDAFHVFKPKNKVYRVKTESGNEIVATADHPFMTKDGMVELGMLGNRMVSVFPFEGVGYEAPSAVTIISERDVGGLRLSKTSTLQIKKKLKEAGLLQFRADSRKFPRLLRLLGFAIGDATFYYKKGKRNGITFYGEREDLEDIRNDIKELGFGVNNVYSRKRSHKINTRYAKVEFEHVEESVRCGSQAFAVLMLLMGLPHGNKARQDFAVPEWLKKCALWQKRLFLAGLFGAELSSPSSTTGHKYTIGNAVLSMNKHEGFVESGREFLRGIEAMLKEFGIDSKLIAERDEYTTKDGKNSIRLRLVISNKPHNLIGLYSKVGFEFNSKRRALANASVVYLRLKESIKRERTAAELEARKIRASTGLGAKAVWNKLKDKYSHVNFRFIERSLYEGRKTPPRISLDWIGFDKFFNERTHGLGRTGQVWEKIKSREEIEFSAPVMDVTVSDENHNFIANGFVVSNCGVRTLRTPLKRADVEKKANALAELLFQRIPAGLGSTGHVKLTQSQIDEVLVNGAEYTVAKGLGLKEDLEFTEENGRVKGADPSTVSSQAKQRGYNQIGTLGSGNHYIEVQYVDEIFDEKIAKAFGLEMGQILVSIHCGSRGLGHQIGTDYLKELDAATRKYNLKINDRELVCAPINSPEGRKYLAAVRCGINSAFANRQVIAHLTRGAFAEFFGIAEKEVRMLYDIGHNTAKAEKHKIDGTVKELLVQRKGSTRGFGPGREEVPEKYRSVGQPILIGGTMGTESHILCGTEKGMNETFGSSVHGAGRVMSRIKAMGQWRGEQIVQELAKKGIIVKGHGLKGIAEEAPGAYKDVADVVDVMHKAGISTKVARLKPMVCIKG